jgi:large subunit ribosomal protein L15
MAEAKSTRKKSASKTGAAKKSTAAKSAPKAAAKAETVSRGAGLRATTPGMTLATLRENAGARPKRVRIGRGHGSGMVKTGGEGGKGQTVRSGGGKGPAFEGGQTPWARRLPHKRGYSQKGRDTGHFGTTYAVVNLSSLADWDPKLEVSPQSLAAKRLVSKALDGIKILGGIKPGKTLPSGLTFRDVMFSASAREALVASGAKLGEPEA